MYQRIQSELSPLQEESITYLYMKLVNIGRADGKHTHARDWADLLFACIYFGCVQKRNC